MLEIIDLAKRYGPVVGARRRDVHRPARAGSSASSGPNGAGKTTTMRCIFGLARPDRGEVRWDGPPGRPRRAAAVRLHARAARPLPADAGRRAAQLLRPAARHARQGRRTRPPTAGSSGWASRDRREVEARGAVARQPAARPARDGARPRPGAARPRRAVLRPRPDRHRDDDRGPPRARRGRRRRRLLAATSSTSSRTSARTSSSSPAAGSSPPGAIDELKAASGRRHLEVEVVGVGRRAGSTAAATCTVLERSRRPGQAPRRRVGRPRRRCWPGRAAAGEVRRFAYQPPKLSELFMEAVAAADAPTTAAEVADEPLAEHLARRPARDPGARPQPRLHPQRPLHDGSSSSARSSCRRSCSATTRPRRSGSSSRRRPGLAGGHRRRPPRGSTGRSTLVDLPGSRRRPTRPSTDGPVDARRRRPGRPVGAGRDPLPQERRPGDGPDRRRRAVVALRVAGRARSRERRPGRPGRGAARRRPSSRSTRRPRPTRRSFLVANIGAVLILVGIFSFGFTVLTGVVEEKQSRVVEVVLSTVRPRDLLMGKVLGIGVLGLVQLARLRRRRRSRPRSRPTGSTLPDDDARGGRAARDLVRPRLRALLDRARVPRRARVADGGGVERLDAGDDDRDDQLLRGDLRGRRRPVGTVATIATFLPPSAPFVVPLRAAFDAIARLGDRPVDPGHDGRHLGPVRRRGAGLRRGGPPDGGRG